MLFNRRKKNFHNSVNSAYPLLFPLFKYVKKNSTYLISTGFLLYNQYLQYLAGERLKVEFLSKIDSINNSVNSAFSKIDVLRGELKSDIVATMQSLKADLLTIKVPQVSDIAAAKSELSAELATKFADMQFKLFEVITHSPISPIITLPTSEDPHTRKWMIAGAVGAYTFQWLFRIWLQPAIAEWLQLNLPLSKVFGGFPHYTFSSIYRTERAEPSPSRSVPSTGTDPLLNNRSQDPNQIHSQQPNEVFEMERTFSEYDDQMLLFLMGKIKTKPVPPEVESSSRVETLDSNDES